jgi:alkylation response protein AidB-like acyl-CoA dehydrogenase
VRFALTDDDQAIRDTVRALLRTANPPEVVRAAWTASPGALDRSVWSQLTEIGFASMLVPEADGGLGFDERTIAPVLEEVGYAGVALPVVETVLLAPTLVAPESDHLYASDLGGRYVPWAADADHLLLRSPDGAVHLVEPEQARITPVSTTDGARRLGEVSWSPGAHVVCDDPAVVARAVDRATFGTAAVLVGVLQRLLDMTVQHVTERHQFGQPIGSFQAVKHHLADAHMRLAFARPAVHHAAWSLATGDPLRARHVALAKLLANQASRVVTRQALQCHGAIGYTVEYDLHLFLKRAWALGAEWGSERELHRCLATDLGLAPAAT